MQRLQGEGDGLEQIHETRAAYEQARLDALSLSPLQLAR